MVFFEKPKILLTINRWLKKTKIKMLTEMSRFEVTTNVRDTWTTWSVIG